MLVLEITNYLKPPNSLVINDNHLHLQHDGGQQLWFLLPRRKTLIFFPGVVRAISCYKTSSL